MKYKKYIKKFLLLFTIITLFISFLPTSLPAVENNVYINSYLSPDQSGNDALVATICKAVNLFTGPTGQALVVIVIIITGVSMFFGKMTWIMAAIVMIGIGIVFGAENIVNNFLGGKLYCKSYVNYYIAK